MIITTILDPGTKVRFSESKVNRMDDRDQRRFRGQVGVITGYQAQRNPQPFPTVVFPKFGRFKEEKIFGIPWKDIELAE